MTSAAVAHHCEAADASLTPAPTLKHLPLSLPDGEARGKELIAGIAGIATAMLVGAFMYGMDECSPGPAAPLGELKGVVGALRLCPRSLTRIPCEVSAPLYLPAPVPTVALGGPALPPHCSSPESYASSPAEDMWRVRTGRVARRWGCWCFDFLGKAGTFIQDGKATMALCRSRIISFEAVGATLLGCTFSLSRQTPPLGFSCSLQRLRSARRGSIFLCSSFTPETRGRDDRSARMSSYALLSLSRSLTRAASLSGCSSLSSFSWREMHSEGVRRIGPGSGSLKVSQQISADCARAHLLRRRKHTHPL